MTKPSIPLWTSLSLISLLGGLLFAKGYFPVKPLLPGYTSPCDSNIRPHSAIGGADSCSSEGEYKAFDRLAFVLVDALRSDFVFSSSSNMPFVTSLINNGEALPFTAIAQSPTVTLPRLKALTTGTNPTFLDAILNLHEQGATNTADSGEGKPKGKQVLQEVDSWVRQFVLGDQDAIDERGQEKVRRKVVLAGDDTWLRIFPKDWFVWTEGVSSFFVSDTVTVDTNVTRHLSSLLSFDPTSVPPSDWDVLILHYLGLDHVGHLSGPTSPLMPPKQLEMDNVLYRIYSHLQEKDQKEGKDSLLVLIGDHGMNEIGNHGGSSEGESSAALVLASPTRSFVRSDAKSRWQGKEGSRRGTYGFHQIVNQIDLVPTLSTLFGLGIPKNSMGRIIESVLEAYGPNDIVGALRRNARQLEGVLEMSIKGASREIADRISETGKLHSREELSQYLALAQKRLMTTFSDSQLTPMALGMLVQAFVVTFALFKLSSSSTYTTSSSRRWIAFSFLVYLGTFFATSFIEEEHEFWFFAASTASVMLVLRTNASNSQRRAALALCAIVRVMRGWSPNGQKDLPNSSFSSILASSPTTISILLVLIYPSAITAPLLSLAQAARPSLRPPDTPKPPVLTLFFRALSFATLTVFTLAHLAVVMCCSTVSGQKELAIYESVLSKLELNDPVELARLGYVFGALTWIIARGSQWSFPADRKALKTIQQSSIALTLMSLTRATHIPLFALLWSQYFIIPYLNLSPLLSSSLIIVLQRCSFFAFGGSNSLATVDLSNAYNGLRSYSLAIVTLQTFLSNFQGPIFLSSLYSSSSLIYTTLFHSASLLTLCISATHFRTHLFTWTVFSPAVLYQLIWSSFIQLLTHILFQSLQ